MTMTSSSLYVLLLAVAAALHSLKFTGAAKYPSPDECKRLECAPYTVINTTNSYEIRTYHTASWIATSPIQSSSYVDAITKGFMTLFRYIDGDNAMKMKLKMTAPVLTDVQPAKQRGSIFVVHFYLPKIHQSKPPPSRVAHPVKLPKYRYAAARRFGGFMNDTGIPLQAMKLKKSLEGSIWSSASGDLKYSIAGYSGPDDYKNRVNEVIMWFN